MPSADVGPSIIPDWLDDEDAVLLTDALPTGYFAAQLGDIAEGDTVVVFGAGPVGLFAAKSAWLMGAGRVVRPSRIPAGESPRLRPSRDLQLQEYDDIAVHLKKLTDHLGADVVIDAVGAESDGNFLQHVAAAKFKLQGGSPVALGD